MSERITQELRLFLADPYREWAPKEKKDQELKDALDNIDAINANLERENESLRRELDRVLGEEHDFAPESHYMMLPKDADGEPIHLFDLMETERGVEVVEGILPDRFLVLRDGCWLTVEAATHRHHTPDSWERIIEDAVNVHGNGFNPCWTDERDALVARCKALAGDPE